MGCLQQRCSDTGTFTSACMLCMWRQPQREDKQCWQASITASFFVGLPPCCCCCCRLNRDNHALHPPAVLSAMTGQVEVSMALQVGCQIFQNLHRKEENFIVLLLSTSLHEIQQGHRATGMSVRSV